MTTRRHWFGPWYQMLKDSVRALNATPIGMLIISEVLLETSVEHRAAHTKRNLASPCVDSVSCQVFRMVSMTDATAWKSTW